MADTRERSLIIFADGNLSTEFPTNLYYEVTVVHSVTEASLMSLEKTLDPVLPIIAGQADDDLPRIAHDEALGL